MKQLFDPKRQSWGSSLLQYQLVDNLESKPRYSFDQVDQANIVLVIGHHLVRLGVSML